MARFLSLSFLKPGLQTTVQDLGRTGWQEYGVPVSGAMDKKSFNLANYLVSNPEGSPCLEITLIGPEIHFDAEGLIALTGAHLSPKINGRAIKVNHPNKIYAGDILSFGKYKSGCRSYLAVHGEWMRERWLGSCSEVPYTIGVQGLPPPIEKNTSIEIRYTGLPEREVTANIRQEHHNSIRIIPGPEYDQFSTEAQQAFFTDSYEITNQSNRMGYRLKEKLKNGIPQKELISSGTVPGTIQVTQSGQIIVLMADAQTTGGYPRFGVVVNEDLDILAQKKPGDKIQFTRYSLPRI